MNNPLRFAGETFYQSGVHVDEHGHEITTLQVVTNTGWMIPYVACMMVGTGMLAQFSITLVRFLRRRSDERSATVDVAAKQPVQQQAGGRRRRRTQLRQAAVSSRDRGRAGAPLWVARRRHGRAHAPIDEMQLDEFGRLPVVYEGRVKPFDTLARNMLR